MWGWDRGPTPHSVHSTHVRSTVRVGKGEHWTGTGLVSGVHPGTLERHTPTAAEYSPVYWCAFRVRVRCLEQAAVGFLDWLCSNDSNRHVYITSQRFRTLPIHPISKPEQSGGSATALWASVVSHPHTVRSQLSEPSGGGPVRGAASRWCCHLLGTSSHDPYVAYVSGRYAAEARGGLSKARQILPALRQVVWVQL